MAAIPFNGRTGYHTALTVIGLSSDRIFADKKCSARGVKQAARRIGANVASRQLAFNRDRFVLTDLLAPGPLVDLVIMDLAFLAPRCHRHAYAFASVGAAGGTVPTFFVGIDHVAQFAMDHSDAGDQRTDIAVNINPELHHVGVP